MSASAARPKLGAMRVDRGHDDFTHPVTVGGFEVFENRHAHARCPEAPQVPGDVLERFGAIDVALALVVDGDRLTLVPRRWSCLGIPLPNALLPKGTTRAAPGLPAVIASRGLFGAAFACVEMFLPLVLQGESGNINQLLASTASLTSTIADRDAVIGSVVNNLNLVLDTVNARDETLSSLIVSLPRLVTMPSSFTAILANAGRSRCASPL